MCIQVGLGQDPVHEADAVGFRGVDHLGQQGEFLGAVQAHPPWQHPGSTEVDGEAATGEDLREPRRVGCVDEVAPERHVQAGSGRHAVHLGHDRVLALMERLGRCLDPAEVSQGVHGHRSAGPVRLLADIGTRTEVASGSGQDDRPHALVCAQLPEDPAELAEQEPRHGVHDLWSVQHHGHDVAVAFHVQPLGPFDHASHDALPISVVPSTDHKPVPEGATHPAVGRPRGREQPCPSVVSAHGPGPDGGSGSHPRRVRRLLLL